MDIRLRLRAFYHASKLFGAGIIGNKKLVGEYIEINGDPDKFCVKHNGEAYPGSVIYLIREQGGGCGFCAELKLLLEQLWFAESYGFIPKVFYDGAQYLYSDGEGGNAFEQFFEPVGDEVNVSDALNVIISKPSYAAWIESKYSPNGYQLGDEFVSRLVHVMRKHIHIKKELEDEFKAAYYKMFNSKKVLGVHYRGSDYKVGYKDHPKMTKLDQTIEAIDVALNSSDYEMIFLATDDSDAAKTLEERYQGIIKMYKDVQRTSGDVSVAFIDNERANHRYLLGKEILRDVFSLSLCDGLVGGVSQVTFCANLFKKAGLEEYKDYHIIDNGINTDGKAFKS